MEEADKRLIVKVLLGVTLIGGVLYIIYQYLLAPLQAKEAELKAWMDEYLKEYRTYIEQSGGTLTDEQKEALDYKRIQIERVSKEIMQFGWTPQKIYGLIFSIATVVLGIYVAKKALDFFFVRIQNQESKTSYGVTTAMMSSINVDFADAGFQTLAAAAQTTTENWVNTYFVPTMQTEIVNYQALIPQLTGLELLYAQYMVTYLQYEIATGLAAILTAAWLLIPPL